MADIDKAIDYVLRQEDSTLSGVITNSPHDLGGMTRFGITAKFHPDLVEQGFFSPAMPVQQALVLALRTYAREYALPLYLDQYQSQAAANSVLSFAVVAGVRSGQEVVRGLTNFNFSTVTMADDYVVPRLVDAQKAYFDRIVARDPSQQKWLKGWHNRAEQALQLIGKR